MGNIFGKNEDPRFIYIKLDGDYARNTNSCYNVLNQVERIAKHADTRDTKTYIDVAVKMKQPLSELGYLLFLFHVIIYLSYQKYPGHVMLWDLNIQDYKPIFLLKMILFLFLNNVFYLYSNNKFLNLFIKKLKKI